MTFQSTSSIQRKTRERTTRCHRTDKFQSTSSIQRKTKLPHYHSSAVCISIHFLYTEEDRRSNESNAGMHYFNPLPLYRGRLEHRIHSQRRWYFNPLPLYRGRPSIAGHIYVCQYFNPLPLYRGRLISWPNIALVSDFNPLPLYRGRRPAGRKSVPGVGISIHFLYTEEDLETDAPDGCHWDISIHFLYTEEDFGFRRNARNATISIHFLYTEEDVAERESGSVAKNFNPLPLYRGRRKTERTGACN